MLPFFADVHERVVGGVRLVEIAEFVHERGELTDLTRERLVDALKHYRASLPPTSLLARPSRTRRAAEQRVREGIDEVDEYERLYRAQMARIEIDLENEKSIGKLLPGTVHEIARAREILESRSRLRMDLGLNERSLGKLGVDIDVAEVASTHGASAAAVAADPVKRHRVLAAVHRLLRVVSRSLDGEDEPPNRGAVLQADAGRGVFSE